MPLRTIWIRVDDLEAFEAIEDRPEWLHNAIHGLSASNNIKVNSDGTISPKILGKPASFTSQMLPFSHDRHMEKDLEQDPNVPTTYIDPNDLP
jgi:hypothetical protein